MTEINHPGRAQPSKPHPSSATGWQHGFVERGWSLAMTWGEAAGDGPEQET